VTTHAQERYLQAARQRQETAEFKELYQLRSRVERKIAELVRHGLRQTRYRGQAKRQFQRLWTGAAVNLKRLFTLAEAKGIDLAAILDQFPPVRAMGQLASHRTVKLSGRVSQASGPSGLSSTPAG
jgi:hypothetical protein